MSVVVLLVFLKTTTFSAKDEAKHFHQICLFPKEHHKGIKMFPNSNTLRGIVQDKINPNILKNAILLLLSSC